MRILATAAAAAIRGEHFFPDTRNRNPAARPLTYEYLINLNRRQPARDTGRCWHALRPDWLTSRGCYWTSDVNLTSVAYTAACCCCSYSRSLLPISALRNVAHVAFNSPIEIDNVNTGQVHSTKFIGVTKQTVTWIDHTSTSRQKFPKKLVSSAVSQESPQCVWLICITRRYICVLNNVILFGESAVLLFSTDSI